MKKVLALLVILGVAVWIRDNNAHFILKGLLAAWPILLLLAVGAYFIWQGIGTKAHRHFRHGHGNRSYHTGDPLAAARDRAKKAGVDLNIPHPDD